MGGGVERLCVRGREGKGYRGGEKGAEEIKTRF